MSGRIIWLNDPVNYFDPDGEMAVADDVVLAVVGTATLITYLAAPSLSNPDQSNLEVMVQTGTEVLEASIESVKVLLRKKAETEKKSKEEIKRGPKGGVKHKPGHDRKSEQEKKRRYRKKVKQKQKQQEELADKLKKEWESLSESAKKIYKTFEQFAKGKSKQPLE